MLLKNHSHLLPVPMVASEVQLVSNSNKFAIVNLELEPFLNTTNIVMRFYHPKSVPVKMEYVN